MCMLNLLRNFSRYCSILCITGVFLFSNNLLLAETCTPYPPGEYAPSLRIDSFGNPHVAWEQILDNGKDPYGNECWQNDIYYTRSTNQGETFLPATAEIDRVLFTQARVSLAIDPGGNPAVAWVDTREGGNSIYFAKSLDYGEAFSPGIPIDVSLEPQNRPFLLFDSDGNPIIAWIKTYGHIASHMNPVGYIYVTKSTDGGLTFLPSVCVYCNSRPYQGWPSLVIDSYNNPMVVAHYFRYEKNRWNVYFIRSLDQGGSFEKPVLVENSRSHQVVAGKYDMVVDTKDNPYIAITDNTSGHWNIRLVRSLDGGLTFQPSVAIDSWDAIQLTPSLGIDSNDNLYIAWTDGRNGYHNIYFTMSKDGGVTFRQSIPIDQEQFVQKRPSLDVDFNLGIPHISWADERQGICYIYYTRSIDNGLSFLPSIPVYEFPLR